MFVLVGRLLGGVAGQQPGLLGRVVLTWVLVAVAGAYIVECIVWPHRRCWACKGSGKLRSPVTKSWRECRCGGDGQAIRWGRRVYEAVRHAFR